MDLDDSIAAAAEEAGVDLDEIEGAAPPNVEQPAVPGDASLRDDVVVVVGDDEEAEAPAEGSDEPESPATSDTEEAAAEEAPAEEDKAPESVTVKLSDGREVPVADVERFLQQAEKFGEYERTLQQHSQRVQKAYAELQAERDELEQTRAAQTDFARWAQEKIARGEDSSLEAYYAESAPGPEDKVTALERKIEALQNKLTEIPKQREAEVRQERVTRLETSFDGWMDQAIRSQPYYKDASPEEIEDAAGAVVSSLLRNTATNGENLFRLSDAQIQQEIRAAAEKKARFEEAREERRLGRRVGEQRNVNKKVPAQPNAAGIPKPNAPRAFKVDAKNWSEAATGEDYWDQVERDALRVQREYEDFSKGL